MVLTVGVKVAFNCFVAMKKFIKAIVCSLILFTVGCDRSDTVDVVTRAVTLYANDVTSSSRTTFDYDAVNDKFSTSWSANDAMQVVITADDVEAAGYTFELKDAASGRFACDDVADISSAVNAYGVYPSTAEVSAGDLTAVVEVGSAEQSQQGETPSHVAKLDPLWGNQTDVALDEIRLQMHHTAAVMQFKMQNLTDADVVISSVKISASKPIAGKHTLNMQSGELVAGVNVSNTINLTIEDGAVAKDEVFKAWVAMSPFEMSAGDDLTFVITTSDGKKYLYTKTFGGEVEFPSGKVMSMSAPVVLSEESLMVESKSVSVDLTKAASYPDNFPIEKTQYADIQYYQLGDYPFKIFSTKPYTCSKNKNLLKFYFNEGDNPTTDDYALIYLPYYEGYKIKDVNVAINKPSDYEFRIAIANPENLTVSHDGSNNPRDTNFDATDFAKMNPILEHQCCIYVHFYGVKSITTNNCNCYISSISVNYILE